MDKRIRVYQILVVVLIILNVLSLGSRWFFKDGPRRIPRIDRIVEKELDFSESQKIKYQQFVKEHREFMRSTDKEMYFIRESLIALSNNPDSAKILSKEIGALHEKISLENYRHLEKIRSICDKQQIKKLDGLVSRALFKIDETKRRFRRHHH